MLYSLPPAPKHPPSAVERPKRRRKNRDPRRNVVLSADRLLQATVARPGTSQPPGFWTLK